MLGDFLSKRKAERQADGHFGLFGDNSRINYTFTFDGFEAALAALLQIQLGQAREIMTKR
jgi:hypothetical protein